MSENSVYLKYFFPIAARLPDRASNSRRERSLYREVPPPEEDASDDELSSKPISTLVKNLFVFDALASMFAGGVPIVSQMRLSKSYSLEPGKMGKPRNSSAATHPRDHISMGIP
jgi:hypothetical protein